MLKKTVSYIDFNDQPAQDDLYFNITRSELPDMLPMMPQLEAWQARIQEPSRKLTNEEVLDLLNLIKKIIGMAYGERSEDGKRFAKSPELTLNFTQTAAYDALMMSLFVDPNEAAEFIAAILPKDLPEPGSTENADLPTLPEDTRPAWLKEDRDPTEQELKNMSTTELQLAFQRRIAKAGS